MVRLAVVIGFGLVYLAAPLMAVAAEGELTATNGEVLPVPEIASLDCERMAEVLDRYTESAYRGPAPLAESHPDRPLFDYEDALAAAFYRQCQSGSVFFEDTSSTFGLGFN